ncbi:MAG: hypothetical protein ACOYD4_03540 [Solirubrobacterales bacterium]
MSAPLADLRVEAPRVLEEIANRQIAASALGGLAVFLRCRSARQAPLAREYKDLDLAAELGCKEELTACLIDLGYLADEEFNLLHGHQRLYFWDPANGRQLDVFVAGLEMCHRLDLRGRVHAGASTLELSDLLLAKLQVVEVNEKDLQDSVAILADHELGPEGIDPERIVSLFADDWGWWRTGTGSLRRVGEFAAESSQHGPTVAGRVARLLELIEAAPKSRRWRLRARVGERKRWYTLPEEVEG